ncbi:aminoglycoside phosphotransferase family protein [Sporosarcina sp. ACRSL]|uniref:aminoglycoside phosphotransferase family protein n=1 Tax=Sporosarcina sp. ACRSL TaxID=2918215 RepID=UPI001EF7078E|nr:aminoglycoside phosphotransferase family protein [Sporosarcina sp. ACRSL]MCG7344904.1 aminoglycoside phosphotransferase family protein [Sporosarcina sp. ACRSL]
MNIELEKLIYTLNQHFKTTIISTEYQTTPLQGGTVGDVYLVTGTAETVDGEKLPYRLVLKIQKKWERYGDTDSWRREYDLYSSELGTTFSQALRWPKCYHAEFHPNGNEYYLWLEYIDGVSGLDLTSDMYEQAALELGRFQGKLYAEQPALLQSLTNLSHPDLMKNTYLHYRSWPVVYDYIRSQDCELTLHVRQMLIDIDEQADEIFARIEKLPLVLCHRDFWVTNLIYSNGKIALIDWDTSGWGYLGEDLASLIADEPDIDNMVEHYQRCIPAYYKGFSEYADESHISDHCIYEIILLVFGYRLIEGYLYTEAADEKSKYVQTLQKIYEMKAIPIMV